MDYNINVKDNSLLILLMDGAMCLRLERKDELRKSRSEGNDSPSTVAWRRFTYKRASVVVASMQLTFDRNHHRDMNKYASDTPTNKAEMAVLKAGVMKRKAEFEFALAECKDAEESWLAK